jgi:hypothetical protein
MGFGEAVAAATRLRDALAAEVERAIEERRPIRELDAAGLFDRVQARAAFVDRVRGLERELADELAAVARDLRLAEPTLAALERAAPGPAAPLRLAVEDIRRLAAELLAVHRVNRELTAGALTCVQGYLAALRPAPRGYDRRGHRPDLPEGLGTVSRRL